MHQQFLQQALALAEHAILKQGGPFGAVVIKGNQIVGQGFNQVTKEYDPTAHAEVVAIRNACQNLQTHDLSNCILYSSCEPCPMCLSASYWANIAEIFFAADRHQAARAGFIDADLYQELQKPLSQRKIPIHQILLENSDTVFEHWCQQLDKIPY